MIRMFLARYAGMIGVLALMGMTSAQAWSPPAVGRACAGMRGDGPRVTAIAGNYLGGAPTRGGMVNRMAFQGCFARLDACETWLADKARRYPLPPGIATCTPVVLR
jgi:hypothetical protein